MFATAVWKVRKGWYQEVVQVVGLKVEAKTSLVATVGEKGPAAGVAEY
jgi:hypothetical protein